MAAHPILHTLIGGFHPFSFQNLAAVQTGGRNLLFPQGGGDGGRQRIGRVHFRSQQHHLKIFFLVLRPQPSRNGGMSLGQRPGLVKDHHIGLVQPFQSERILYPDMHIGGFAYPAHQRDGCYQAQRARTSDNENGNNRIKRMRHGFHTAEQYPDKKHGNRRSRQHGKDDIGYAVFTMQFFGQEPEHFTGQPHCDNQYGHFVIHVRLKSRVMPVVRKERVEQAEKKSHGSAESNQRVHGGASLTEPFPGIRIKRCSQKQQRKRGQRQLYLAAIGHIITEYGKQQQRNGQQPRADSLHLQTAVLPVTFFHVASFHTIGIFRAV